MEQHPARPEIPREDEQVIAHINDLLARVFTLSEVANLADTTREEALDIIAEHRADMEDALQEMRDYKDELEQDEDFEERMECNWYLMNAYQEMRRVIRQWDAVLT